MAAGICLSMIFLKRLSWSMMLSLRKTDEAPKPQDKRSVPGGTSPGAILGRYPHMPWHIGIDEAGYGPNLGPFVMTLVACQAPDGVDLWDALEAGVRRADDPADHRLIVADSKQ